MSQGLPGSPHLTVNHRHVQPFAGAGKDRGGTPGALPQPPALPSRSHQAQTLPHSHSGAGALPGQGDTRPHHVIPLGQPGVQPQTSLALATVPGMRLGPAWLHGTAECQPRAGSGGCPALPPGMHSQSRAQSTAHSSQALTDRQTWAGCSHSCSSSMEELEAVGPRPSISSSPVRHEHKRSEPDSQHCQRAEKSLPQSPGPSLQNPAHPGLTHPSSRPTPALHARPNTTYGLDVAQLHLHPTGIPGRTRVLPPRIPTSPSRFSSLAQEGALTAVMPPAPGQAAASPSLLPWRAGEGPRGSCVGLEAGAGVGRGFHTTAQEGESTSGCVMKPHPAWSALPVPLHANVQETPLTGASTARSHGSASPPTSHPDPLTRASFLPSPPSLLFPAPPSPHPERCSPTALSRTEPPQCLSTSNTQVSLLFPSWQMPGCATQNPAIQTAVLIPAAAQGPWFTACLARVSAPYRAPCHRRYMSEGHGGTSFV